MHPKFMGPGNGDISGRSYIDIIYLTSSTLNTR
jgi:hypothetical protein